MLITGRFHGLLAALATRTPFVAWPGNTDKIEAVLSWLGAEECLARTPQDLVDLARSWRERADVYERVFDRVAQAERWRLNLAGPRNTG